jgi:hypothetical protein
LKIGGCEVIVGGQTLLRLEDRMKLTMLATAAAIGLGAMMLPAASQAAPLMATPSMTAPHSSAIQEARMVCHSRRVWIHRHRGPHGRWIRGHWVHRRVCHHM